MNLSHIVEAVLEEVDYPGRDGLLAYAAEVRSGLVKRLPSGASAEAFHRHVEFVVRVRVGANVYEKVLELP